MFNSQKSLDQVNENADEWVNTFLTSADGARELMGEAFDKIVEQNDGDVEGTARRLLETGSDKSAVIITAYASITGLDPQTLGFLVNTGQLDAMKMGEAIIRHINLVSGMKDHLIEILVEVYGAVMDVELPRFHPEMAEAEFAEVNMEEWMRQQADTGKSLWPFDMAQEIIDKVRQLKAGVEYFKQEAAAA